MGFRVVPTTDRFLASVRYLGGGRRAVSIVTT
jgi:hypothetical protein